MNRLAPVAKAIVGALIAGVTALLAATIDDGVSLREGLTALLAMLSTGGGVWAVPNRIAPDAAQIAALFDGLNPATRKAVLKQLRESAGA